MVQNQKLRLSTSLGRSLDGQDSLSTAGGRVVQHVIDPVEEHRDPADTPFRHGYRQPGEP